MNRLPKSNDDLEPRIAATLLEVLIRAGLILILTIICYQVFSPFMILVVWAVILAVTLYPLHQRIARRVGGRQGIASTLLLIVGFVLIAVPTAILVNSLGDSVNELIHKVQANSLQIPAAWEREESKLKDDLMTLARAIEKHIEELNHFMVRNQKSAD
jgi:predicted PurR-regulated permease PerM